MAKANEKVEMGEYQKLMLKDVMVLMQSLDEPFSHTGDMKDAKYSVVVHIPKDSEYATIFKEAYEEAVKGAKKGNTDKSPIQVIEEDEDGKDRYGVGDFMLKATTKDAPYIINKFGKPLADGVVPQFKSRINLAVNYANYTFKSTNKKGLGVYINGIMVTDLVRYDKSSIFEGLLEDEPEDADDVFAGMTEDEPESTEDDGEEPDFI